MSNGEIIREVVLFMANQWSKEIACEIFGSVMGIHFWNKWIAACGKAYTESYKGPDYATMRLFYEMSSQYMDKLADYAISHSA